jgi:hypothetical protein
MPDAAAPVPAAPGFPTFWLRVTACHVVSYFVAGILAYTLMDYQGLFRTPGLNQLMLPLDSPWVAAGPALQVFRGLLIAAVVYPFRRVFLDSSTGWLMLFALLAGLSALSASGPAPGSLEGLIYTRLTLAQHLRGLPELIVQNALFAWALWAWCRRPGKAWTVTMSVAFALVVLMSGMGVMAALRPMAR